MKRYSVLLLVGVCLSCGGVGGENREDAGGNSDAQGACVMGNVDPLLPDLIAEPMFSPPVALPGNTVTASIPVDAETGYVSVVMFKTDRSEFAGGADATTTGAETLEVSFETMASATPGPYFFIINACTSRDACITDLRGIAYAPSTNPVSAGDALSRLDYDGETELGNQITCYGAALVTLAD